MAASRALLWPKSVSFICPSLISICLGSTPMRSRSLWTSLLSRIFSHSSALTMPSFEVSAALKVCCSVSFISSARAASSSFFEVSSTTEQSTPISMLSSVSPQMTTKRIKTHMRMRLSSLMAMSVDARLSPSTPRVKSDIMEEPRSENISFPVGSAPSSGSGSSGSPSSLVKRMAKMYVMMIRNSRTKKTAFAALIMPFTSAISSGKKRMILAMRVSRSRRRSRKELKDERGLAPPSDCVRRPMIGRHHVSSTMNATRVKSKRNQASKIKFLLWRRAMKRMTTSPVK
mmetsp:Transcript_37977/g.100444  ORF Transcript_37977/g.100444 Transcript_37977/m.100444 type:complete len:287 (-) Transcript_37977:521-1381(-)